MNNSITSDKNDKLYEYLRKHAGVLYAVSLNDKHDYVMQGDMTEYQKQVVTDIQEDFIESVKTFIEFFNEKALITDLANGTDPYLDYVNIDFRMGKSFYDSFYLTRKDIKLVKCLCLTAGIDNTYAHSSLDVRLYGNEYMLDLPYILPEYKECFNMMLDILEKALLAKGIKMYEEIEGIVKFPI